MRGRTPKQRQGAALQRHKKVAAKLDKIKTEASDCMEGITKLQAEMEEIEAR